MEERSLRVYQERTFFSKLTTTITKLLIPTNMKMEFGIFLTPM